MGVDDESVDLLGDSDEGHLPLQSYKRQTAFVGSFDEHVRKMLESSPQLDHKTTRRRLRQLIDIRLKPRSFGWQGDPRGEDQLPPCRWVAMSESSLTWTQRT